MSVVVVLNPLINDGSKHVKPRRALTCWSMLSHRTGSDVVEWLFHHIEGFQDRREARKYASNLLKAGFIRHTVNKITFSEQCYYVFGDLSDCENCE